MDQMQRLLMSCPELGAIETMIPNVSVKHPLSPCTSRLAVGDSLCSEHLRDIMASVTAVPCSAPWPGRLGCRKDILFSVTTADLWRPSHTMQSAADASWQCCTKDPASVCKSWERFLLKLTWLIQQSIETCSLCWSRQATWLSIRNLL